MQFLYTWTKWYVHFEVILAEFNFSFSILIPRFSYFLGGMLYIISKLTFINCFQVGNLIEKSRKKYVDKSELKLPLIRIKVISADT